MISAVYELTTCKPHLGKTERFDARSWAVYCDGYYTALCWAVRVMHEAIERRRWREKMKRQAAREQRAAAGVRVDCSAGAPASQSPAAVAEIRVFPPKNKAFYRPAERLSPKRRRA